MPVKKEFRRLGITKELLKTALEHARHQSWDDSSNPSVILATTEFQIAARKLYEQNGFVFFCVL